MPLQHLLELLDRPIVFQVIKMVGSGLDQRIVFRGISRCRWESPFRRSLTDRLRV